MIQHPQPRQIQASQPAPRAAFGLRASRLVAAVGLAALMTGQAWAADAKADPAKGQQIAAGVCAACHGADGNSATSANPHLAGQHAGYLAKQLADFKSQARANPIMAGMVANLSEADMRDVAAWFSQQTLNGSWAEKVDLAKAGERLYRGGDASKGLPACAGCHGPNGAGIPVQFPALSGQFAAYTAAQLTAFRQGTRTNSDLMAGVAARLSDAEIAALAEYIAGLR
ncbi:MAG: c-type cytochrome [Burkholderiaceae bacterium]